jgi:hypothetical protein
MEQFEKRKIWVSEYKTTHPLPDAGECSNVMGVRGSVNRLDPLAPLIRRIVLDDWLKLHQNRIHAT